MKGLTSKKLASAAGAAALVMASLLGLEGAAEAAGPTDKFAVAAKLGANWSLLNAPTDPRGEPTLLSGSAFDGMGFSGGATGHYHLSDFMGAAFEFEAGLVYSYHAGEGFEEISGGPRQTLTLSTHMFRVPLLVHLKSQKAPSGFRLGVGIVPMLGMQSAATVEIKNSNKAPEPLHTTPTVHLGLTTALGYDFLINHKMSVPLEFRATWDPFVSDSTRERFDYYASLSDPGNYQVAFNWQLFFMTGLRYEL